MWKIIDFANNYEVSDQGQVRNRTTGKILKGRESKSGYLQVSIKINETGKFQNKYIHRLVAQFFINNPEQKKEVNHKDGNKLNNLKENLEWVTSSENQLHRQHILNKRITSNRKVGMYSIYTDELIQTFNSVEQAGKFFNKSRVNIDNALKHKNNQKTAYGYVWKYLDQEIVQEKV